MLGWDDIRYFIAVARHGSTLSAARAMGVNQSTVHRRVAELEGRIGHGLVRRHPSGYQLTELGLALLPLAEDAEKAMIAIERQAKAYANELKGIIRLTCPEPLVSRISNSQFLSDFYELYPSLRVEFVMSDGYLDLSKGEADVALRSGEQADEKLVGRRIGDSVWAVYGSRDYVHRHGTLNGLHDIANHTIIGFEGALSNHRAAEWLRRIAPDAETAATNNSVLGVLHAVMAGLGISPLPTTIANMHETLVQLSAPVEELNRGWYLLTHPDIRKTPRIIAFFDYTVDHLNTLRPLLMG
ncbi:MULTISPECIES: LysR family transcriptional regulator [Rhizobium]|uniref:LysR family transcriptional regulator n=1 Tax=Rhizobium TaxID=379 RepID=UPI00188FBE3B|nr:MULTISPECIES: LysR family transcriptional regulator [unclassified Rhizobium]QPB21092.1 LysR family transcriptional regulator [Rhizobium sp. 007]WFU86414.1 LysR family transcriptional regulator [Rhizobium sp. CC1099]